MAIAAPNPRQALIGVTAPRIAPPIPAKSRFEEFNRIAVTLGIKLIPWQAVAARYLNAINKTGWRYPEVCISVARQNGKTEILLPRILMDLRSGRRVIHTAQNRTLPRKVFVRVARALDDEEVISVRYANGQEKIEMRNGGEYVIVAPQRGARGLSADTLIFDEVREFEEFDIIAAASPTLTASSDPQTIYLSNAGSDMSVVLNDLRRRGEEGGGEELAYLEWSAAPERQSDDREGWAEANPSLGYFPHMLRYIEKQYASLPPAEFETEHLCRWVTSMQPKLISSAAWEQCRGRIDGEPINASMAINMDPSGKRASAVLAWQQADGRIALVELSEATGDPIDVDALGKDLRQLAAKHKVRNTAFASWTDADLARHLLNAKALDGKEFANASETFVRVVTSGRLIWDSATHITDDLTWTARKPHESGAWMAVKASEERSITASLAAIRAVYLAAAPKSPGPRIF
jgi:hypothetical protein